MNKLFPLAIALVSLVPASAFAVDAQSSHDVTLVNGNNEVPVGSWSIQLAQEVDNADIGLQSPFACRYFVGWTDNVDELALSASLQLDEIRRPGHEDCEINSNQLENPGAPGAGAAGFTTLVVMSPKQATTPRGFDAFQQKRRITYLTMGEAENGDMSGLIQFSNGALYGITVDG